MRYNRWSRNPITDPAFADEVRRHYAACVSYVDAQVGLLMDQLDRSGMRENTIVVLWGDHGWHLGEYGVWGKHTLFEESLRSPLIISYDNIVKPGEPSTAIVETVDILPTICDLAQIPAPAKRAGTNLNTQLKDPGSLGHSALAFQRNRITIRNKQYRLIVHKSGFRELYDFSDPNNVSINRAQELPEVVNALEEQLNQRLTDTGTKSVALW
jgi:iduronate 2-sulfatase